ncbi:hypothetical protein [Lactobacillus phage JNU_P2]|nr:hypothetical protein [Lactobacillus phage JNU_P2]QHJ74913.1 hypothetical protein [Lactobacillus phage JNU_P4]
MDSRLSDSLATEIIQHAQNMSSRQDNGCLLPTSDMIAAMNFADKLNQEYPDAKFEALRHTPTMYLSIHKY